MRTPLPLKRRSSPRSVFTSRQETSSEEKGKLAVGDPCPMLFSTVSKAHAAPAYPAPGETLRTSRKRFSEIHRTQWRMQGSGHLSFYVSTGSSLVGDIQEAP